MRRTSRYPTRSTVNRAQQPSSGAAGSAANSSSESRSQRTRSQVQEPRISVSVANGHDFARSNHHAHHPHQSNAGPFAHMGQMYRQHQQANQHLLIPNMQLNNHVMGGAPSMYRPTNSFPAYSMPVINESYNRSAIKFMKLNSYDEVRVLIKTRGINQGGPTMFQVNDVANYLRDDHYRVFLRFCKYNSALSEQNDCLPKSFNLVINSTAFQVKNKYTFAPYDITTRVACERNNEVYIKCSLDPNSHESSEDFYFGLFLVKKVDHKRLFLMFKTKPPLDIKYSIDLVRKKLNPDEDDDEIAIVENANLIKVSLLCPLSSTRIKVPARSRFCDHVHCFDAEHFININEITPRWKCPICKIYIKLDDMVVDTLFLNILSNAPADCVEADIFPDGHYDYVQETKPVITAPPSTSSNSHKESSSQSTSGKRKYEEDDSKTNSPVKAQKTESKQIECITLDSDSEEEADSDSTITDSPAESDANAVENGTSKEDQTESDDDEIMIVYEKLVPTTTKSTTSTTTSSSKSSSNSNSASPGIANPSPSSISYNSSNSSTSSGYNASNNPNSRYNNSESHRPAYATQTSLSMANNLPEANMMNNYGLFKYPTANSQYSQPTSSSSYGLNCNRSNTPNYLASSLFSTAATSTASLAPSMPSSSQSLLNFQSQPSTSTSFINNYMPSTSFNAPSATTQPIDLTSTIASIKTDALPDFSDQLDFSWYTGGSHSKEPNLDFNGHYSANSTPSPVPRLQITFDPERLSEDALMGSSLSNYTNYDQSN